MCLLGWEKMLVVLGGWDCGRVAKKVVWNCGIGKHHGPVREHPHVGVPMDGWNGMNWYGSRLFSMKTPDHKLVIP